MKLFPKDAIYYFCEADTPRSMPAENLIEISKSNQLSGYAILNVNDALKKVKKLANIDDFISSLPNGYLTEIGNDGTQVSMGQRQRVLLARAVYKNPGYLLLDEATSSLDANNERVIMDNLNTFFEGRTVIVIAHRLSTVQHAHQIIVMEQGKIMETGNHQSLTAARGKYYELVKNQLELGS
jgi:ATP-binding cassette subfamily B protein